MTLPPVLLAQLARTGDVLEQKQLVRDMKADAYLGAMSLPPPSPAEEGWASANAQLTHNGIPILLQQVFTPETSGLTIMAPEQTPQVQFYASAEQWAVS
ncbi:MAG: hypothetical protein INR71_13995, partial [Terriglobus roseus]|nr:hypothetical protein [Terriglobus roseus]